jgi:2-dehydro-3-deoxyphosphooctonate aldolase (KDO 8-P synthase)
MSQQKKITFNNFSVANDLPISLIAGPCVIESRDMALYAAEFISNLAKKHKMNYIFKSSFDKANRMSVNSPRNAVELEEAIRIFEDVKRQFDCPVLTDVHNEEQIKVMGEVVDVLQIPAFLCRQTDLLIAAGETGKVVNVKKGQFLAPWDMKNVAAKVASTGNDKVMLTERGVSFGYNRLVNDMRALPIMAESGYPVVFDATHSIQEPGGQGTSSGGQREFVPVVSRAAVAVGVAAIFIESHPEPEKALSDSMCQVSFNHLDRLLTEIKAIDEVAKQLNSSR